MKVLIACEESQTICKAFRECGHEAYSNDVLRCSGGHHEWHILEDAQNVMNGGRFKLQNGKWLEVERWDLIIAHPPCTFLSNVTTRHHSLKTTPINKINGRTLNRISAMTFFMRCVMADCDKIAVENPVGVMNTCYRKPDQILEPFQFAESSHDLENYVTKKTCLWLKNLPPLETNHLERPSNKKIFGMFPSGKAKTWEDQVHGAKTRSKTFSGIARAMAKQWGEIG